MRFKFLSISIMLMLFFITACSGTGPSKSTDLQQERKDRRGSFLGDGITLGGEDKSNNSSLSGVAVNAFLWRASLDTISFMPLNQVDPFGGVIITDWYSPPKRANERFKLNVYILSQELRSDGLRVSAFKETRDATGQWQTNNISKDFALQMEDSILTRARQMRVNALENSDQ